MRIELGESDVSFPAFDAVQNTILNLSGSRETDALVALDSVVKSTEYFDRDSLHRCHHDRCIRDVRA